MVLDVHLIGSIRLFQTTIISYILALCVHTVNLNKSMVSFILFQTKPYLKTIFRNSVVSVLFNDALSPLLKAFVRLCLPPVYIVAIFVKLPPFVVLQIKVVSLMIETNYLK